MHIDYGTAKSVVRRFCAGLALAAAFALPASALAAATILGVENVSMPLNGEYYTAGEQILIDAYVDGMITDVSNVSSIKASFAGILPTGRTATCTGADIDGDVLHFSYTVQAGDYSDGATWAGGTLGTGSVNTDNGALASLDCIDSMIGGEPIAIRTFFLKNVRTNEQATELTLDSLVVGKSLSDIRIVNAGGSLSSDVEFSVIALQDNDEFDQDALDAAGIKILSGAQYKSLSAITAQGEGGPVDLLFDYYNNGRLTLHIENIIENIPLITKVEATSKEYTTPGKQITITVTFSEKVKITRGSPRLLLNVENADAAGDAYATCTATAGNTASTTLKFTYTTRPGDFIGDLDVVEFDLNGADMQTSGNVPLSDATFASLPIEDAEGSLASTSNVKIQTLFIDDAGAKVSEVTKTMREENISTFIVTRGGDISAAQQINVYFNSDYVSVNGTLKTSPQRIVIPAGASDAEFTVEAVQQGSGDNTLIRIHPIDYPDDQSGDCVIKLTINPGDPAKILLSGTSNIAGESDSNDDKYPVTVRLSRAPRERTTVKVVSADPTGLPITEVESVAGASLGVDGSATFVFEVGQSGAGVESDPARVFYVVPKDGKNGSVMFTATAAGGTYIMAQHQIFVANSDPWFTSPAVAEDGTFTRTATAGFPTVITWAGADVAADRKSLKADIEVDGRKVAEDIACSATGSGSFEYTFPTANENGSTVAITIKDKDGGFVSIVGIYIVAAPFQADIFESKMKFAGETGHNPYKSLPGLGRGTIDDSEATTTRILDDENCDWHILYPPFGEKGGSFTFFATPETFVYPVGSTTNLDSFFYAWYDIDSLELITVPLSSSKKRTYKVEGNATSLSVAGIFSREHYPEDGCGDIDFDGLPDAWEDLYFSTFAAEGEYPFEIVTGDFGAQGNPDNDFLPAGAFTGPDGGIVYPLQGSYAPNGIAFANIYEVRGIHHGLNMRKEATDVVGTETHALIEVALYPEGGTYPVDVTSVTTNEVALTDLPEGIAAIGDTTETPEDGVVTKLTYVEDVEITLYQAETCLPIDEPHKGKYDEDGNFVEDDDRDFYGTDPTNPDSDGDGLLDGYEYYWWRVATEAIEGTLKNADFQAYDPTKVVEGKPINPADILKVFHPLVPTATDGMYADIDGDGLSNYEEMLLGTNPCHWDTDGDGMNDGWEVMWGLNPMSYGDQSDAGGNPDGDFMAAVGDSMTNLAYRHSDVYKHFGFDPRTAWIWEYKDRNRHFAGSDPYVYAPNTMPFTNYEEHYLGRWCIDKGIIDAVEPMSKVYMTQPVPAMATSYMTHSGFSRDKVALNKTAFSTNGVSIATSTNVAAVGSAQIDIPPVATLFQTAIKTHGCDSDSDGMPDGWELYCCCGPEYDPVDHELWPIGETSNMDADFDCDFEGLPNLNECQSTELCDYYAGIIGSCTNSASADVASAMAALCDKYAHRVDATWYNKWWPTDPWNIDTDYDCVDDYTESANFADFNLRYAEEMSLADLEKKFGGNTMLRGHVPGGGLNPNAADTDMDYIPDFWEYQYCGFNRDTRYEGGFIDQPGTYGDSVEGLVYGGGMDGTYFDSISGYDEFSGEERNFDFDRDGLENYQEYWVNGMYNIQYDKWYGVYAKHGCIADYDSFEYDPGNIFATGQFGMVKALGVYWKPTDGGCIPVDLEPGSVTYDWSRYADDWQNEGLSGPRVDMAGNPMFPFTYMPPEPRPMIPFYASSDPRLADTDADNMDDYYEMFHGLNPILSQTFDGVSLWSDPAVFGYDFRISPWLSGMPNADPDQDDIPNWEEALSPNQPAPANHNTDPSPAWFTDISYPQSFVNLYYNMGSVMMYWAPEGQSPYTIFPDPQQMGGQMRPNYLFSFEMNEGYDTDNDNLSDKYEIAGVSGGVTDPQDTDRPVGRKALYLDGDAAARTRGICAFGKNALRSWTIEAWVRPEQPATGKLQVILERPCAWSDGSPTPNYSEVRRTFRLALDEKGRPFVSFETGGKNVVAEWAKAPEGDALEANRWYHLAATMDGFAQKLSLYVDGRRVASKATAEIPYTGFTYSADNGAASGIYSNPSWAPMVIGASDSNPVSCVDGGYLYSNGGVYKLNSQPSLGDFFKGWVDEVRIWTGVRPGGEDAGDQRVAKWHWSSIKSDFDALKRYGSADALASREETVKQFQRMVSERYAAKAGSETSQSVSTNAMGQVTTNATTVTSHFIAAAGLTIEQFYETASSFILLSGGEDAAIRIPPLLLCDYCFDNLPDPDYETVAPAKFDSVNGRPLDYSGQPWWRQAFDRSTVYRTYDDAPYCFPQYIENLVATQPLGSLSETREMDAEYNEINPEAAEIPIFKYRPDRVVNSKFWTRDQKGGVDLDSLVPQLGYIGGVEGLYENSFPNTANPYGLYYITSNSAQTESHPTLMNQEVYDPVQAVMYNHLLPLRNARADMSVQLWDDPAGDKIGVNADSDGDGLPDYWELANGLDPFSSDQNGNGIRDDQDDFDGDGLSNIAEFLAGTNPMDATTRDDGVNDYDASPNGGLSYGYLYTDNDYVLDGWEALWDPAYASPYLYDENNDRDLDGWDNWSEALVGTRLQDNTYNAPSSNTNEQSSAESSAEDKMDNFPMPALSTTINYVGDAIVGAKLVVHAYTSAEMNGWPDAVFVKDFSADRLDTWPMSVEIGKDDLVYGHLRQGMNWFYAWFEKDDSKIDSVNGGNWPTWTPGEPAAIADNQLKGIEIGWDRNEVTFHFVDEAKGFARLSFEQAAENAGTVAGFAADKRDHDVVIKYNGSTVFTKTLQWPRVWLHEGDIVAGKTLNFGLGSASISDKPNGYQVAVDGFSAGVVTNWYRKKLEAPVALAPIGQEVVFKSRPEFIFRLDPAATEFQMNIKKFDPNVSEWVPLYNERILAPGRDKADGTVDLVTWKFPYSVGDLMPNGVVFDQGMRYKWTVTGYNPTGTAGTSPSTEGVFWMASENQQAASAAAGRIAIDLSYPGNWAFSTGKSYKTIIRFFRTKSFNGNCEAGFARDGLPNATVYGLECDEDYYVMAFIDQNGNAVRDDWEPWGYYRDASSGSPFMPVAVRATKFGTPNKYEIVIRDPDTDNDLLPDSWEYAVHGNLTAAGGDVSVLELRGALKSSAKPVMALFAMLNTGSDSDGDGVSDVLELFSSSNALLADTDGDGIADGDEIKLFGSAAATTTEQKLAITGVEMAADGSVTVKWDWVGVPEAGKSAMGAMAMPTVVYEIQSTDSLANPNWKTVKTVTECGAVKTEETFGQEASTTGARFFRVILKSVE